MTFAKTLLGGLALAALTTAGCKQGQGDRCQVTSDCGDNLVCVIPSGGSLAEGGTCQPTNAADAGVDMTLTPDAAGDGPVTTGEDLSGGADLTTPTDGAAGDLAGDGATDGAAPEDMVTPAG